MQLEKDRPALRKRAIVALSTLVDVVSNDRYDRIMNRVLEGFDNAGGNLGNLRTFVSAAAAICRASSPRFVRFLPEVRRGIGCLDTCSGHGWNALEGSAEQR